MRTQVDVWLRRLTAKYFFTSLSLVLGVSALQPSVASAETCLQATAGTYQWQNAGFTAQSGIFTYQFRATAQAHGDTIVALSQAPARTWTDLAAIVRFNTDGWIDARDGDTYRTLRPYGAGQDYRFVLQVDVPRKLYSVWVGSEDGPGDFLKAKDFHFRTEQSTVTSLSNLSVEAEVGGVRACASDPAMGAEATPGPMQWQNRAAATTLWNYTGDYAFVVTPRAANSDALIALSNGPQTFWSNLAAIVRFNTDNTIDVRYGDHYQADVPFSYTPGVTYRVVIEPSTATHTYTVLVAAEDQPLTRIASNYPFRTEQQGVTELNNWVLEAEQGDISASPFPYPY